MKENTHIGKPAGHHLFQYGWHVSHPRLLLKNCLTKWPPRGTVVPVSRVLFRNEMGTYEDAELFYVIELQGDLQWVPAGGTQYVVLHVKWHRLSPLCLPGSLISFLLPPPNPQAETKLAYWKHISQRIWIKGWWVYTLLIHTLHAFRELCGF